MTTHTHSHTGRRSALVAAAAITVCFVPMTFAPSAVATAPGTVAGHQGRQDSTLDDEYRKMVNHGTAGTRSTLDDDYRKAINHGIA